MHLSDADLRAYLNGGLDEARDEAIAAHLAACPACVERLRAIEESRPPRRPAEPPDWARLRLQDLAGGRTPMALGRFPRIQGYTIEGELGRGGMGIVYRASHEVYGTVALKTISEAAFAGPDELKWFRAECEAAKAMSDRASDPDGRRLAVVKVFEIGESDGVLFISMELAAGKSVADHLDRFPMEPDQVARVMAMVAEAVADMHRHGEIHRDLKPENLLLQLRPGAAIPPDGDPPLADLDPMVADYGLARRLDEPGDTRTQDIRGTLEHLAPEQLEDGKVATPQTDIHSLGVTLYRMLTGESPYSALTPHKVLSRISKGLPTRPSRVFDGVPAPLEIICLKCLERDPARRYATADELAADLRRYREGAAISARRASLGRRAWRACRRYPFQAGAIAAGLFVLAVVSGVAYTLVQLANADALRASERAEDAERVAAARRLASHVPLVEGARTAVRRGDWASALPLFAQAIEDAEPDQLRLRVERLFGLLSVNDRAGLERELADLSGRADLGPLAASVELVRGTYLLCDPATRDAGLAAVRKALETPEALDLSPADRAFAEALTETNPGLAVDRLREAAQLDPFHIPVQTSLLVALTATGRFDEAKREARRMRAILPGSFLPDFVLATAAACEGDRAQMRADLDRLAERFGPARAAEAEAVRGYCEHFANVVDILSMFDPLPREDGLEDRLDAEVEQLRGWAARQPSFDLPVPTIGLLAEPVAELAQLARPVAADADPRDEPPAPLSLGLFDRPIRQFVDVLKENQGMLAEDQFPRLVELNDRFPDGLVSALMAMNRMTFIMRLIFADKPELLDQIRAELARTAELCERAVTSPTLLPRSRVFYKCKTVSTITDVSNMKITRAPDRGWQDRLRDNQHRLVVDGRATPEYRAEAIFLIMRMILAPINDVQKTDWRVDLPEGRQALLERNLWFCAYLEQLILDWKDDEPGDPRTLKWLKEVEDYRATLTAAPPDS